jgi:hypothetical protein
MGSGGISGLVKIFQAGSPLWRGEAPLAQVMALAVLAALLLMLILAVVLGSLAPTEKRQKKII